MINKMISEYSKLVNAKYKTKYDSVGKVIHRVLRKILKVDNTSE